MSLTIRELRRVLRDYGPDQIVAVELPSGRYTLSVEHMRAYTHDGELLLMCASEAAKERDAEITRLQAEAEHLPAASPRSARRAR